MLAWRLFHNRIPTDEQLQKRGIPTVSVCQLCSFRFVEDSTHLFVSCSFAQHVWQWLACCFGCSLPSHGTIVDLWNTIKGKTFSPQLKNLWIAGCLYALMAIWKERNKLRFDNKIPSLLRVFRSIRAWLRFIAPHTPGHTVGLVDFQLLVGLGIQPISRRRIAPRWVLWHPPITPWIKLNTDGLAKGNPGPAACGGVFRDEKGRYLGGFCQGLGHQTAFFAELMGVIIGIEFAFQFGWNSIWLESDSTSVLACIVSSSFVPPWPLRIAWSTCLARIRSLTFHCSHVLREGNTVADRLTNMGLASTALVWYSTALSTLSPFLLPHSLSA
ncbi:putative ribonuclease H-like domain, reverse transcriptase zinc-binding domain-containing protein [Rosa chinensis]|uniref:Putative ribonuclease H-like domain, reverse transcriptase zinc-binding domain-containing protein n=1 Tax=Rosa chinensis TaxID=74649 RepID=A0A2P6PKU8_ROSCH|nr:putative ribonuclease H-like domain, reverse transcriptase zinc-binding domain-containing protein [Rosa chinensis]